MNTRLLAIAMMLCTFAAKAQYVTIPDPAFALFLQQTYPNCMNGNQMDTTCSDIVNEITVNCSHAGIIDLEGIQYFDNLSNLNCSDNSLTTLHLPSSNLITLYCGSNQLTTLPPLPNTLGILGFSGNHITSITSIPATIYDLNCSANQITTLPNLPASIVELRCGGNLLTTLPPLPMGLKTLNFSSNPIASFPSLPSSTYWVECSFTNITNIPFLPDSIAYLDLIANNNLTTINNLPAQLRELHIRNCSLVSLPALPDSLQLLECSSNSLTNLPSLPSIINTLECSDNQLSSLPQLPSSLIFLQCYTNAITQLPSLPPDLDVLSCASNQLQSLPALPPNLTQLMCDANYLTALPPLPNNLFVLTCGRNPLQSLPQLPQGLFQLEFPETNVSQIPPLNDFLKSLHCPFNPNLTCLPKLHDLNYLNFTNTSITCIPNYSVITLCLPPLDSLPLCDQTGANNCEIAWNIAGRTYFDSITNCTYDSTEQRQANMKVELWNNGSMLQQALTGNDGFYSFDVNNLTDYVIKFDTTDLPFTIACPNAGVYYDTLTANDSLHFNRNFALQCETGFDLAAQSVASAMVFRPANNTVVDIHAGDLANFYQASCAQGVSGTVSVKLHGPISYIGPANGATTPSSVSNNVLTWNVADFGTADALHDFNIIIQTDTFAQSGQQACFEVNVAPLAGDNDTSNNHLYHCFNIVNSYDPNDKTAYPAGNIDTTQEWLTYTVRFQNTGNAEAQHIYIMDTLDANVKEETFQLLSYSHQPNVQINENIVRFNFPNINLPDSISDEPGSHGYVQYKVKLKEDLAIGTAINNTAYIYFDFNPPVVTNTATNTIAVEEDTVEVGIRSMSKNFDLLVYPNPANQQVTIVSSEQNKTVTIYNMEGRMVLTHNIVGTATTLNIAQLPSGVYTIGINGTNLHKRLVKL